MAFEGNTGLQVASQYGARFTGNTVGVQTTKTGQNILSLEITSKGITEGFVPPLFVPKGAKILRAYITVDAPLTGVTALSIGEGKAEATNGLALVTADLAVGTRDVAAKLVGTWATTAGVYLTKTAAVGVVATGTPSTATGKATVTIEYLYNSRDQAGWVPDKTTLPTYKAQP